jgi:hypothetical protein
MAAPCPCRNQITAHVTHLDYRRAFTLHEAKSLNTKNVSRFPGTEKSSVQTPYFLAPDLHK